MFQTARSTALLVFAWMRPLNYCVCNNRPTVDEQRGNEDKAVRVDTETGVLRKTPRPGMGTIMANERVGEARRPPAQPASQPALAF